MTDLVERLREIAGEPDDAPAIHALPYTTLHSAMTEAADEIERLRARIDATRQRAEQSARMAHLNGVRHPVMSVGDVLALIGDPDGGPQR